MKKRVLIVEDEPSIVTSLEFLMHRCGYETCVVTDGAQVLDQVAAFAPHLVLLDVMLPGRSGFEICRHIRSLHGRTRVLLLTAKGARSDVASGMEAGADDYVTKPFSTHDLVDRVRALIEPAAPAP
jgi:two-component system, OmpR family, alkaline phosphatase synthesis response regulator PhoP